MHKITTQTDCMLGMREICPNNFGNNDRAKELRIIPEF